MSKKNNLSTRARYHNFDKQREAAAEAKKAAKVKKTIEKKRAKAASGKVSASKLKNGIKIKRKVSIRGIKIRTAEDKERVKEILKEEQANKMQL